MVGKDQVRWEHLNELQCFGCKVSGTERWDSECGSIEVGLETVTFSVGA